MNILLIFLTNGYNVTLLCSLFAYLLWNGYTTFTATPGLYYTYFGLKL